MKIIKFYKGNALIKLGIAFFVVLAFVACQESKMKKEGERATNAFLEKMNPELAKKITEIEREISITKEKSKQLSELKLKHPNYADTIETSRREWIHLQNKLKDTLKEIGDTVESTYVAYELDKIQGGRQLNKISDKLLSSANSVLISANTARNVIDQTLYDLEDQSLDNGEQSLDNTAITVKQESPSPSSSTTVSETVSSKRDVDVLEMPSQEEKSQTINDFWDVLPSSTTEPNKPNLSIIPTKLYKVLRGHTGDVNAVAFSPDGRIIASGSSDTTVKLWGINNGKEIKTLRESQGDVLTVAFNSDNSEHLFASGGSDRTIRLWNINTRENPRILVGHEGAIHSVAFNPNGRTLVSGSWDNTVRIWDIESARELRLIKGEDSIYSVAFSPDGQLIAVGSFNETITIWETDTGRLLNTLQGNGMRTVYSVAFSPDGKSVISGDQSNNVRVWDTQTGNSILILKGLEDIFGGIFSVAVSPNGSVIASGSSDETIIFWEANTGKELHTHRSEENEVRSIAFSSDGRMLASGHDDNTIKLWKVP
ncbi:WD40 repeat domain-containing protein [Candidatus Parabeggiatoa sp. HSG14]|uniref:WD40 repeat domain-containing protein n=1 Tax=Candidatus Parabeggiatoa sp. HSG14 TaxID=3055593 RepID=UPI0025A7EB64|nr:WD40 repeat domain-containing protein [Thiotrichales bacterium HSG14]